MLDRSLLDRKLSLLSGYIADLLPLILKIPADYSGLSKDDRQLMERRFQLVVDTMTDINIHIIREGNFGDPDDIQSTFKMLGEHRVLDLKFAEKISPVVGVRNMIVHQYEKLDASLFLRNLKNNHLDFNAYISQINDFLKRQK